MLEKLKDKIYIDNNEMWFASEFSTEVNLNWSREVKYL